MNKLLKTYEHDKYMNSHDHNMITFGPDEKYIIAGNCNFYLLNITIFTTLAYRISIIR